MLRYVVVFSVLYLRFLCVNSFQFGNIFEISDTEALEIKKCERSSLDSQRFYLKTPNSTYDLPDSCNSIEFSKLIYFPKCCPPEYSYESIRHNCVLNGDDSINIYGENMNLLVRSHLDCHVIIDHIIDDRSVVFHKRGTISFNNKTYDADSYCVDSGVSENSFVLRTCENIEVCKTEKCIRKCCKDGSSYVGTKCVWNPEFGISVKNNTRFIDDTDDFTGVVQMKKCNRYKDQPHYGMTIRPDGSAHINFLGKWVDFSFEDSKYCVEYYAREKRYVVFVCAFPNTSVFSIKTYVMRALYIISCISLVLTILGYVFLRELKNFLGKIIICYSTCLLLALSFLTYGLFKPSPSLCVPLGFLILFFHLAAFAWMNVLSFEIWHVLGSMSTQYGSQLYNERKKFMYYHIYAWSLPVLVLILAIVFYHSKTVPEELAPTVGRRYCFIEVNRHDKSYGFYIYWVAPSLLYIIVNSVLFFKTIRYIFKVKNDIKDATKSNYIERQNRFRIDMERVSMVIRIFVIMGVSWLMEFIVLPKISASNNTTIKIVEHFGDAINCLQGFLIFCVFLMKKKIFIAVKQKMIPRRTVYRNSTTEMIMSCSSK